MGGDFNSRHHDFGDTSHNQYGNLLIRARDHFGFRILNPSYPTCYHNTNGSYIDKFLSFNSKLTIGGITNLPSFSDHSAICTVVNGASNAIPPVPRFFFDLIDSDGFNKYVDIKIKRIVLPLNRNISTDEIDLILTEFSDIITKAIHKFVPRAPVNNFNLFRPSSRTMLLRGYCKRLQRKLFRIGNDMQFFTKNILIGQIRQLKIMIRGSSNTDTAESFSEIYENIKSTSEVFGVIKRYTGHKRVEKMGGSLFTDETLTNSISGTEDIANALGINFLQNHGLTMNVHSIHENTVNRDNQLLAGADLTIHFGNGITPKILDNSQLDRLNQIIPNLCRRNCHHYQK